VAFRVNITELQASKLSNKVVGVNSLRRNIQGDSEGYVKILGGDNIGLREGKKRQILNS
jgi:hypothetical protein